MSIIDLYQNQPHFLQFFKEYLSLTEKNLSLTEKISLVNEESETQKKIIRVLPYCNWTTTEGLCKLWSKMSKTGNCEWNNLKFVTKEPTDYYVVINSPPLNAVLDKARTILFRMEPNMENNKHIWGEWAEPNISEFLYVGHHSTSMNNLEWHLSKTYAELSSVPIIKSKTLENSISSVLSDKYSDIGHIRRIDFAKLLERKGIDLHVFGGNKFMWKNYMGDLPSHSKDNALFPYKYTFNCENHFIKNYVTEKLVDGILSECLTFYYGCINIRDILDERAYVYLDLADFEKSAEIIERAIKEDWWSQRIEYIRAEKHRILNNLQFFPRIYEILSKE